MHLATLLLWVILLPENLRKHALVDAFSGADWTCRPTARRAVGP